MSSKTAADSPRPPRPPWSLAARLAAAFAAAAFLLLLAAIAFPYFALAFNLDREDNETLTDKIAVVEALLKKNPNSPADLLDDLRQETELQASAPVLLRIIGPDNKILAESRGMAAILPTTSFPNPGLIHRDPDSFHDITLRDGRAFRTLTTRFSDTSPVIAQAALDRTDEARLLIDYRRGLLAELTLGLLASAAIGYIIARRGLRPITHMAHTVRDINSASLNARLDPTGVPPELSALALAFNTMLQRLEDNFDRLSRFSADIAHELRTPISNIRGLVEVSLAKSRPAPGGGGVEERDQLLAAGLEECARLSRLIDALLFLARAENPQTQIHPQPLDLAAELANLQEFYEPAAREAGVTIECSAPQDPHPNLDRILLQRALGNLIDNALAHTPAGGAIRLTAERRDSLLALTVSDTGHGIPPEHLPRVFERFHRVDPSRSKNTGGLGLGLAIVKSIATLHGGSVEVTSQLGRGTQFTLLLPDHHPVTIGGSVHNTAGATG